MTPHETGQRSNRVPIYSGTRTSGPPKRGRYRRPMAFLDDINQAATRFKARLNSAARAVKNWAASDRGREVLLGPDFLLSLSSRIGDFYAHVRVAPTRSTPRSTATIDHLRVQRAFDARVTSLQALVRSGLLAAVGDRGRLVCASAVDKVLAAAPDAQRRSRPQSWTRRSSSDGTSRASESRRSATCTGPGAASSVSRRLHGRISRPIGRRCLDKAVARTQSRSR